MQKKSIMYGDLGSNRATVTEEELDLTPFGSEQALLRRAGKGCSPLGDAKYLGSAAIHYYSREVLPSNPEYFVICQTVDMKGVVEHHADVGYRQLKTALMKVFGRKEPRRRS